MFRSIVILTSLLILSACTPEVKTQVQATITSLGTTLVCNELDVIAAHNNGDQVTCAVTGVK